MRQILLCTLGTLIATFVLAQERQISGTVTDGAEKVPLPGVSILIKGTTSGATTDAEGRYRINVPANAKTLVFSFVGFATQEIEIGNRTTIDVVMMPDTKTLQEVVVTGYGQQEKKALAGSAAVVNAEIIRAVPLGSFDQMLQGQAPGLLVVANSGQPGAPAAVRIRGVGSINGTNEPLYIVDGVQISAQNFATLNPADFESVNVLKDAAATSIYGSRGSNGVIVVTTRRGKAGSAKIEYAGQQGWSFFPRNRLELMNTNEKIDYELRIGGTPLEDLSPAEIARLRTIETDWQKEIFQVGQTAQHQISASGGNEKTIFYLSGNLFQQSGTVRFTGLDRYTGRVNIEHNTGNLRFGLNATAGYSDYRNTTEANTGIASPLNAIRWANPYETPFQPDGSYTQFRSGQPNPVQEMLETFRGTREFKGVGSAFIEYSFPFLKGLSARTIWGVDYENQESTTFFSRKSVVGQSAANRRNGALTRNFFRNTRWTGTTSLNYTKTFGEHNLNVGLFQEVVRNRFGTFGFTGFGLTGNLQNEAGITPGSPTNNFIPLVRGNASESALVSYFLIANYSYKDRYFASATLRRDGSSRFGPQRRWGNFWSLGGSWVISEESFMAGIDKSKLSLLKLKASYGTVGSQAGFTSAFGSFGIGDFAARELFASTAVYDGASGLVLTQLSNPELGWEQKNMLNAGIEFGLFNDRISGSIEFYNNLTTNMFLPVQLSRTTGFTSQNRNAGKMRNRGIEIALNTVNLRTGQFRWTSHINFTLNRNKIVDLAGEKEIISGLIIQRVGHPVNSHFLVEYAGVNPQNGNALYRRPDGEVTETYSPNDRQIFGVRDAPYFGGITNTFTFKGLELTFLWNYVLGHKIYNNDRTNVEDPTYYIDNLSRALLRSWQKPGDITDIPRPDQEMQRGTTRFLEKGDFWRLRNVVLSYTFPTNLINKAKISSLRLFVQGQNVFTITEFLGFDPEITGGQLTGAQYPALRTVTFGINLGF
ncbi:MAG: TonB-dependent receptor [Cytophagales bacterium]|nr:TonB-dependent receptor [Bernardetiaceae bacterium]MDW8211518.1 TonB-dependent receptor [Cytophagales bacterium]